MAASVCCNSASWANVAKVMVEPVGGGPLLDGIAFNVDTAVWPDNGVREVELAYKLDINEFRGNRPFKSSSTISGQFSGSNLYKRAWIRYNPALITAF